LGVSSTLPRQRRSLRVGGLAAIVAVAAVAGALAFQLSSNASPRSPRPLERNAPAQASSPELTKLEQAIARLERKSSALERKSSALELKSAALEMSAADKDAGQDSRQLAERPSDIELHRAELQELEVALVTAAADARDSRATAEMFEGELATATSGQARVVAVQCAAAFCKAVIEEDTSLRPEMDTATLVDNTPFLKEEAMFDYQREGTRKRTIIYAARQGQSLAAARGVVLPAQKP
jgi:hypothetical protein